MKAALASWFALLLLVIESSADLNVSLNPILDITTEISDVAVRSESDTFPAYVAVDDEKIIGDLRISHVELHLPSETLLTIHFVVFGAACLVALCTYGALVALASAARCSFHGPLALEMQIDRPNYGIVYCYLCGRGIIAHESHESHESHEGKCDPCSRRQTLMN
eukprot:TRINITY_DN3640_c0_g1_i1.p1 TRINITY_DN3640_c0_g1~~TRINITY_DN3640_c0_g1_i1.p1  ORF type:complete len:165 (-),score=30.63 TRINITY_DN3640_c0_g1_i1:122-616(-)